MSLTKQLLNTLFSDLIVDVGNLFNQEYISKVNLSDRNISAKSKRLLGLLFQPNETITTSYNLAKSYLMSNGATEEAASTFALIAANLAKIRNVSIQSILSEVSKDGLGFTDENFKLLNRIRNRMSQIFAYQPVNNCRSFNRNIKYFYTTCVPAAPFFVSVPILDAGFGQLYCYNIEVDDLNETDFLTITSENSLPGWLTLVDNGDRTAVLYGVPSNIDFGPYNILLRVQDFSGLFSLQEFSITINQPPTFTTSPTIKHTHGVPFLYFIGASDVDVDDELQIVAENELSEWLTLVDNGNKTGLLQGTPSISDLGLHQVRLRVRDLENFYDLQSFNIEIINNPPRFTSCPVLEALPSTIYSYSVSTVDVGDILTITADLLPGWLTLDDSGDGTALLSGIPSDDDRGINSAILRVVDSGGLSSLQSFDITVFSAPFFVSEPILIADVDLLYKYDIVVDDVDLSETLSITVVGEIPQWLTFIDYGNKTGVLGGVPQATDVGPYTILLRVEDTRGLFSMQEFVINVNSPPKFDTSPVLPHGHGVLFSYAINASDSNVGDTLTITSELSLPSWLTLMDNGNGTALLSGMPTISDLGSYNIQLKVEDNRGLFDFQLFTILITNEAPHFDSCPILNAEEFVLYTYNISATDPDPIEVLTITATVIPHWLTLNDNGDGTAILSGTPANEDGGIHAVSLTVTDSGGLTDVQSFNVTVAATNPPQFDSSPVLDAEEGELYTYDIITSDLDLSDTLIITADLIPDWLTLVDNGDRTATLSGTPENDDEGANQVILRVADPRGLFATQEFTITVAVTVEPTLIPLIIVPDEFSLVPTRYTFLNNTTYEIQPFQQLMECDDFTPVSINANGGNYLVTSSQENGGSGFSTGITLRAYQLDGDNVFALVASNNMKDTSYISTIFLENDDRLIVHADGSIIKYEFDGSSFYYDSQESNENDEWESATLTGFKTYVVAGDDVLYVRNKSDLLLVDSVQISPLPITGDDVGLRFLGLHANSSYIFTVNEEIRSISGHILRAWDVVNGTITQIGNSLIDVPVPDVNGILQSLYATDNYIYRTTVRNGSKSLVVYTFNGLDFTEITSISISTNTAPLITVYNDEIILVAGASQQFMDIISFNGTSLTLENTYQFGTGILEDEVNPGFSRPILQDFSTNSPIPAQDDCPSDQYGYGGGGYNT